MGVYLSEPNKNKQVNAQKKNGITFCSAEMQGWRKTMEDAAIHDIDLGNLGDGNSLFAVFDGHGGYQISKYVKEIFVSKLINSQPYKKKSYEAALDLTFKIIDQAIESQQGQAQLRKIRNSNESNYEGEFIGGSVGCTANVVLITHQAYYVANAGDSRSVLCREGKAIGLSQDHKPQSAQEQNRIKKAGGVISLGRVNGGLNLTRSFGDFDYKRNKQLSYAQQMITCKPDIKKIDRKSESDEFILVGCDGIWEKYVENSQGLIDYVREKLKSKDIQTIKKVVENTLDYLLAADTTSGIGCDNMTAILIVFDK